MYGVLIYVVGHVYMIYFQGYGLLGYDAVRLLPVYQLHSISSGRLQ
jgi:hypothetical protein